MCSSYQDKMDYTTGEKVILSRHTCTFFFFFEITCQLFHTIRKRWLVCFLLHFCYFMSLYELNRRLHGNIPDSKVMSLWLSMAITSMFITWTSLTDTTKINWFILYNAQLPILKRCEEESSLYSKLSYIWKYTETVFED